MTRSFHQDYLQDLGTPGQLSLPEFTPVGVTLLYGGLTAPTGYLLCDGTTYSTDAYPYLVNLYAFIQNRFGGSYHTDFQVPDMRGLTDMGAGVNGTHEQSRGGGNFFDGGSIGDYIADSFQSHYHNDNISFVNGANAGYWNSVSQQLSPFDPASWYGVVAAGLTAEGPLVRSGDVRYPTEHSGYGAPRYDYETKPATISLNYIIKW